MIVIDTHVWLCWTSADPRLDPKYQVQLDSAAPRSVGVSAICCGEIAKLVELGRLDLSVDVEDWLASALADPRVRLLELSPQIAIASTRLSGFHRDPADQIIVATSRVLRAPLVTQDERIVAWLGTTDAEKR